MKICPQTISKLGMCKMSGEDQNLHDTFLRLLSALGTKGRHTSGALWSHSGKVKVLKGVFVKYNYEEANAGKVSHIQWTISETQHKYMVQSSGNIIEFLVSSLLGA